TGTHKVMHQKANCNLQYAVYGWHPYWVGTAYNNYNFNLLSTFSYFSYELNPSTGNYNTIHSWKTTPSVSMAQAAGCKVELCVTNFGSANNATFLTNSTAQQTFIDSIIVLLNYRNATGVNIDFEGVSGSNRNDLTTFMTTLSSQVKSAIPGATVTMATYSVDWNNVFDFPALSAVVDQFIIMGYGYYYSGSTVAGPTDPLYSGNIWSAYNLIRSINYHLDAGVPKQKLLIGLPYYGYEWETVSNAIPSNTTGNFSSARTYTFVKTNTSGNYSNRQYDYESETPYYTYQTGGNWREAFVCDEQSLAERYDWVRLLDIGGIGIWALGYDDGYTELWNLIENKLTDCAVINCSDTLYDTGGPFGMYRNDELYSYTIAPTGASSISLNFLEFDVEAGFDSLWIYDGSTTNDPLIGGYSGTTLPPQINSSGGALTLEFYSDGATRGEGWKVAYSCVQDVIPPVTTISASPSPFATTDFTSNFTDVDNVGGSGVRHTFYQVADYNTVEWRSNDDNGFFNDDFDAAIHTDWIDSSGIWSITANKLRQSDENNGNTNLYAVLDQNNNDKFLYHYQATISGSGANKRAGFHYMCDDASQTNRGNSYFVWFRQDDGKLQFYKVTNNTFTLEKDVVYAFNAGQQYDCKIVYDKTTGTTDVYVDDAYIDSWTDASPLTTGNAISFRSGNCVYDVDELRVYKDRSSSASITVGSAPTNDIRYENNPATSGMIRSIAIDTAHNISTIAVEMVDVDFTPTGMAEQIQTSLKVYPNPAGDYLMIESGEPIREPLIIRDLAGKMVLIQSMSGLQQQIDLHELASGVYLFQVGRQTVKLIKQ
ncbi:MAG: T9SS type A sorting domain-containing protein, partial [Flavobacteriales bacterium]|nr:T9SS type A sorting domain-containing protein [Flavobacteriales bacterium]